MIWYFSLSLGGSPWSASCSDPWSFQITTSAQLAPSTNKLERGFQNGSCHHQCPHGQASPSASCQCLCPPGELQMPSASPGGSLRSEGGFSQGSFKLLPLSCILDHVRFCVSPLRVESLVSSVLWVSQK